MGNQLIETTMCHQRSYDCGLIVHLRDLQHIPTEYKYLYDEGKPSN